MPWLRSGRAVIVTAMCLLFAACDCLAQTQSTLRISSGQPAPGLSGLTWETPNYVRVTNSGRFVLVGTVAGPGVDENNNDVIYTGTFSSISLLAREGDQVPGFPAATKYGGLYYAAITDSGVVGFTTNLTGPGITEANAGAYLLGTPGSMRLVLRDGDPIPGLNGLVTKGIGGFQPNSGGDTLVSAEIDGAPLFAREYLAYSSANDFKVIARLGDPAPGTNEPFGSITWRALNDSGQTMFVGWTLNGSGIWTGSPQPPQLLAGKGQPAPGTDRFFNEFVAASLNNNGQIAFAASLGWLDDDTAINGMWLYSNGTFNLIARSGDPSPIPGHPFAGVMQPVLSEGGAIAFLGVLQPQLAPDDDDYALFLHKDGVIRTIAREGDAAPGTTGSFRSLNQEWLINSAGQVAFHAYISGPEINEESNEGLWMTDSAGAVFLVGRSGQIINLNGIDRTISWLNLNSLNDNGLLTYTVSLDSGEIAILTAVVPEPGCAVMLVWSYSLLIRVRRR